VLYSEITFEATAPEESKEKHQTWISKCKRSAEVLNHFRYLIQVAQL